MIAAKINVLKILKEWLFSGKSGKYLDIYLNENRDGKDDYGNDGFVVQDCGKEAKAKGVKNPIIGNWKWVGKRAELKPKDDPKGDEPPEDDVPF